MIIIKHNILHILTQCFLLLNLIHSLLFKKSNYFKIPNTINVISILVLLLLLLIFRTITTCFRHLKFQKLYQIHISLPCLLYAIFQKVFFGTDPRDEVSPKEQNKRLAVFGSDFVFRGLRVYRTSVSRPTLDLRSLETAAKTLEGDLREKHGTLASVQDQTW